MLENEFKVKAVIVMTEKVYIHPLIHNLICLLFIPQLQSSLYLYFVQDYYRDPVILKQLHDSKVFILCSSLQFLPSNEQSTGDFTRKLRKLLQNKIEFQ